MNKKILKKSFAAFMAASISVSGLALPDNMVKAADEYGVSTVAAEEDVLRLPIEFIDYRGDNLLFEYIMNYQNNTKYTEDLALTFSSVVDGGGNLVYDKYSTAYSKNLVEPQLGENGLPVYTKEAVSYVANLVQRDLNLGRNDSFTTEFYEAIKGNLFNGEGIGFKRYYFGTGDSNIHNWTVVTEEVEETTTVAEETTVEGETTAEETTTTTLPTEAFVKSGSNMTSTGLAGCMYYDFAVTPDTEWKLSFFYSGASFKYEAIAITDGVEGEVLNSATSNGTAGAVAEQWVSVGFTVNSKTATTIRIKISVDADVTTIIGSGDGYFSSYGKNYTLGSYEESAAKEFTSLNDITTCFDYAYYMLNHYFDKDSIFGNYYGDLFSELELIRDDAGLGYNFLANFDTSHGVTEGTNYLPISYDTENKIIKNDTNITEAQKGFFPLSADNTNSLVKLESKKTEGSDEDETSAEETYTLTQLETDGSSRYTFPGANYEYYLGSWNNSTAKGWADPNDPDHIKIQNTSSSWMSWGTQYYRTFTGLTANTTYTISVDITTGSTSTGDGAITTDFGLSGEKIPKNDVKTFVGTKTSDGSGNMTITFDMSFVGLAEIIDISHYVITDPDGNVVYESPSYVVESEDTIPDAIGIHEAEDAISFSDGYNITASNSFSGSSAVEGLNFWPADGYKYLSFKVNADEAGKYAFKVVYSGGETDHPCNIEVRTNDGEWIATKAADVSDWADPSGEIVVLIDLMEGENTIDVTGASNIWYEDMGFEWIILDYFEISRSLDMFANDSTSTYGFKETNSNLGNKDNYHYAMKSSGKFVYEESENLYFNFTGDDDVYLFVNGKMALDIGGAHFAVNEEVNLNDMKDELGLEEGEIYTFDFFYLERHTDYSNLRINTNIKVMNSGATIMKTAYHDDYTGTSADREIFSATFSDVVEGEVIEYALTMSNISSIPIAKLCFVDEMLNVNLEPIEGTYIIAGKDATAYFAEGNTLTGKIVWDDIVDGQSIRKEAIASIDSLDKLNAILLNDETKLNSLFGQATGVSDSLIKLNDEVIGYKENTQITIGGFKYTIPADETIIVNEVQASFYAYEDINFGDEVHKQSAGMDDHITIIALEFFAEDNKEVDVELTDIVNKVEEINDSVMLQIQANAASSVTAAGGNTVYGTVEVADGVANYTPNGTAYNPVDDDFVYFTTVEKNVDGTTVSTIVAIPVTVHLYDVNEDIYVLDYGIPVDLNAKPDGIFENDEFDDAGWSVKKVVVEDNDTTNDNYGDIDTGDFADSFMNMSDIQNKQIKYTLNRFLEGIDERYYTVKIRKNDGEISFDGAVTAEQGVDLESTVKIMPGNVIYYEDNFVDVKKGDGSATEGGAGDTDKTQSNDQSGNYGNDSAYGNESGDSDGRSTVISTTAYYDEAGKYHSGTSDEVSFTFTGTGFDIIGRTNQNSPFVIVQYTDNGETKMKMVNAYYGNGELYQIPVISIRGLTNESHTVKIMVAPSTTSGTTAGSSKFCLDGIKIYNPSNSSEVINNYLVKEQNAEFVNVHQMLVGNGEVSETIGEVNGQEVIVDAQAEGRQALLVSIPSNNNGIGKPLLLGYSNTEEIKSSTTGLYTNSLTDYLAKGPNNEVYLSGGNAIAFEIEGYVEGTSTIQIEAKRVKMTNSGTAENVGIKTVYMDGDVYKEYELATVSTDTAMYYEIPIDKCIKTTFGYMVVIEAVTTSEYCLSLSNIKISDCVMYCPTYGTYGQIGIDPEKVVLPTFEFIDVKVYNPYIWKDATVEITVFADANSDYVYDEDFDGKFDVCFDSASAGEGTALTYQFAENDEEAYWERIGTVKNDDSTYTFIYRLKMPNTARNMRLTLSHTNDDYTYKYERVITVINPME